MQPTILVVDDEEARAAALEAGAAEVCAKPFDAAALAARVRELVA